MANGRLAEGSSGSNVKKFSSILSMLMNNPTIKRFLSARVQYGHLSHKWSPRYRPYIFGQKDGLHIIDLEETVKCADAAASEMKGLLAAGKKILFVGTKPQAAPVIKALAIELQQPYVVHRWLGGTLTNFATIRKLLKKLIELSNIEEDPNYQFLTKREQLIKQRQRLRMEKLLAGISLLSRPPAALFVVCAKKENTAMREAMRIGIPIFGIVDTDTSPEGLDYPIPANDDAQSSIAAIMEYLRPTLTEGLNLWQQEKETKGLTDPDSDSALDDH